MSQSDLIILSVCFIGFSCIGYFLYMLTKQKEKVERNIDVDNMGGRVEPRVVRGNARRRRGGEVANVDENAGDDDDDHDDENNENLERNAAASDLSGLSKKEIAKIEKRRAKAQQREAMEAEREERKEREEMRMQLLRERELEKEEEFRAKEEERLRQLDAENKRKQEAYNHWKDAYPDHIVAFPQEFSRFKYLCEKSSEEMAVVYNEMKSYISSVQVGHLSVLILFA